MTDNSRKMSCSIVQISISVVVSIIMVYKSRVCFDHGNLRMRTRMHVCCVTIKCAYRVQKQKHLSHDALLKWPLTLTASVAQWITWTCYLQRSSFLIQRVEAMKLIYQCIMIFIRGASRNKQINKCNYSMKLPFQQWNYPLVTSILALTFHTIPKRLEEALICLTRTISHHGPQEIACP